MITVTQKAVSKIKNILAGEGKEDFGLRLHIKRGGCAGFEYGMSLVSNPLGDDITIQNGGVKIFVEGKSAPLLEGAELDYIETIQTQGFKINNPNEEASCGCGHSFTTKGKTSQS